MTTALKSAEGGGEGGAAVADPAAFAAAEDMDAAGAQREPRQERSPAVAPGSQARDDIFTWEAPHATYALGWSVSLFWFWF